MPKVAIVWLLLILLQQALCGAPLNGRQPVLVLDMDGTLYDDQCGIEEQIARACHEWASRKFGLSATEADLLHREHGSTIAGVVITKEISRDDTVLNYYNEVYPHLDMSALRKYSHSVGGSTGYSALTACHSKALKVLHKLKCPIVLASNSPVFHLKRVLARLGLATLPVAHYLTPERRGGVTKAEPAFWDSLLELYPKDAFACTLIDDNAGNIATVRKLGINGLHVCNHKSESTLAEAVTEFLGLLPLMPDKSTFTFNEVEYLEAKNKVDAESFSKPVAASMRARLTQRLSDGRFYDREHVVIDIGAGLLSMLEPILSVFTDFIAADKGNAKAKRAPKVSYTAFESNPALLERTRQKLIKMGLQEDTSDIRQELSRFPVRTFTGSVGGVMLQISVAALDFMSADAIEYLSLAAGRGRVLDLVVGCCVADLLPPDAFAAQLLEAACDGGALVYLPITFSGATAASLVVLDDDRDREVFGSYHGHLRDLGHFLEPSALREAMVRCGCSLIADGTGSAARSDWKISHAAHPYMWRCLSRFLAIGTALEMGEGARGVNLKEWFRALHEKKPDFVCRNEDLLFEIPQVPQSIDPKRGSGAGSVNEAGGTTVFGTAPVKELAAIPSWGSSFRSLSLVLGRRRAVLRSTVADGAAGKRLVVSFTGKERAEVVQEALPALAPGQARVHCLCSLVSTGTELKVFKGERDFSLLNQSYPLSYGYSHVGVVTAVAEGVSQEWLGKTVFSFSPHCSAYSADVASLLPVPDDVSPEDAAFLPSMETAVCLAMTAHPLPGEAVAVVGQGLVGALTAAVLAACYGSADVTAVDISSPRLEMASRLSPTLKLFDAKLQLPAPRFDVCIEVSGSISGLQTAVDCTRRGGKVVVGSWYGETASPLRLGLDFHRSELTLVAAQVSHLPASLGSRWSKQRRFDLAWEMIRRVRPSRLLDGSALVPMTSRAVQEAFEGLRDGAALTALIAGWAEGKE